MGDQDFYYAVEAECRRLVKEMAEIERGRQEIERLGYTTATLIQRKGYKGKQNYYLSHSAKSDWVRSGKPRLEYVGTKPEKIQAAQERVARYEAYRALTLELENIRARLKAVQFHFDQVHLILFGPTES